MHSTKDLGVRNCWATAKRQALRDGVFLKKLQHHFRPGPVLELGAATGHLSSILRDQGREAVASDISPSFLQAIAERGLPSAFVDATQDIAAQTGRRFPNILAQNVLPLIRRNTEVLSTTLRQIHEALEPRGRFICISAFAWRQPNPQAFFSPREQFQITRASNLFDIIAHFPHQTLPPGLYRAWNADILNFVDHKLAWIASVRWVSVMEKRSDHPS
jgi:SAM-dependent methyltransferase